MPKCDDGPFLLPEDLANLRGSGLTDETVARAGIRTVIGASGYLSRVLNRHHTADACLGGLLFPYFELDGTPNHYVRLRPHTPRKDKEGRPIRYESPKDTPLRAYFALPTLDQLRDGQSDICVTEGEKKSLALSQLGYAAIGLGGVYGWKVQGKEELLPDLLAVPWAGRRAIIVFDWDPKPQTRHYVDQAAVRLAKLLRTAGAREVLRVELPPGPNGAKQGVDDFVVAHGPDAFRKLVEDARAVGEARVEMFTASDLLTMELPPPKWAVADLIPEGLALLAGKPKLGKSWLALHLAIAVATGGKALGVDVEEGDVLYLALEDTPRRLQKRLKKLLRDTGGTLPRRLTLACAWPRQDNGGLVALDAWLAEHKGARLVVIDTWARFRPVGRGFRSDAYQEDYAHAEQVKVLADRYQVGHLALHHCRKMPATDPLDEISGTLGLAGCADGALVLRRARGQHDACLFVTGRDVEEERELALCWHPERALWTAEGDAAAFRLSAERAALLDLLAKKGKLTPTKAAPLLGKKVNAVQKLMWDMAQGGQLTALGRGYYEISGKDGKAGKAPEHDSGIP
jgi:hypothetical protein